MRQLLNQSHLRQKLLDLRILLKDRLDWLHERLGWYLFVVATVIELAATPLFYVVQEGYSDASAWHTYFALRSGSRMFYVYSLVKPFYQSNWKRIAAKFVLWFWMDDFFEKAFTNEDGFDLLTDIALNTILFILLLMSEKNTLETWLRKVRKRLSSRLTRK